MGYCCCCVGFDDNKSSENSPPDLKTHYSEEHLLGIPNDESLKNSPCKSEESSKIHYSSGLVPSLERSSINRWLDKHRLKARPFVKDSNKVTSITESNRSIDVKFCRAPVKQTYHEVRSEDVDGNKIINQYVRECKLGMGSYGKVVLHRSTLDNRLYALKIFHKSRLRKLRVAPEETAMMDVQREVDVMKLLDHPNIVNLEEVIDDPESDNFYMVLEYVEGGAIFEGSGPPGGLGESKSRCYFRDILCGLNYLHDHNIIHGDIKPENLLITAEGKIKIGDFGRSHIFKDGVDIMQRSPGTPIFSAPECCLGSRYHGKAADIWALGVTLYCMVFGFYPFLEETLQKIYDKIVNEPLYLPEDTNKDLKHLLSGLLCKDSSRRMSLDAVACHPWVCKGFGRLRYTKLKFRPTIVKTHGICNGQNHPLELSKLR